MVRYSLFMQSTNSRNGVLNFKVHPVRLKPFADLIMPSSHSLRRLML